VGVTALTLSIVPESDLVEDLPNVVLPFLRAVGECNWDYQLFPRIHQRRSSECASREHGGVEYGEENPLVVGDHEGVPHASGDLFPDGLPAAFVTLVEQVHIVAFDQGTGSGGPSDLTLGA